MPVLLAPLLDILVTVIFAAIGRRSHGEGDAITGIITVAWPFAVAALMGWVSIWLIYRRLDMGLQLGGGALVWIGTITLGMSMRHSEGRGIAVSFIIVALIFNGLCMLGWRALVLWRGRQTR